MKIRVCEKPVFGQAFMEYNRGNEDDTRSDSA